MLQIRKRKFGWRSLSIASLLGVSLLWGLWCGADHLLKLGFEVSWISPFPHRQERQMAGIQILGSRDFVQKVEDALKLLRRTSPSAFAVVTAHIRCIRQYSRSSMRADADPPTFDFSLKSAGYSQTWCASCIAHDAYHSKLYHDYRSLHDEPVPYDAWEGPAKERECNAFQLSVLRDASAPHHEIQHIAAQDGTHFDLDGDDQHTWSDYRLQDW
jgi:hypothetical protein